MGQRSDGLKRKIIESINKVLCNDNQLLKGADVVWHCPDNVDNYLLELIFDDYRSKGWIIRYGSGGDYYFRPRIAGN